MSDRHEASVRDCLATIYDRARLQAGSGAPEGCKGDVKVSKECLVECKATAKDSISIKLDWLKKISREAAMSGGLRAMLAIRFGAGGDGVPYDYFVLDDTDLYHLLNCEQELKVANAELAELRYRMDSLEK